MENIDRITVTEEIAKNAKNKTKEVLPDLFVWGLTGSGKDTLGNYFSSYYEYRKIRIAGTIKQIICEKFGYTPEELEIKKRTDPSLRLEHHLQSEHLGNQMGSLNRTHQIAVHKSFDLQLCSDAEKQLFVCDNRTYDESKILLDYDWTGIFLARTTTEFKKEGHFTEQNMFLNGELKKLAENHAHQMLIVFNDKDSNIVDIRTWLVGFTVQPKYIHLPNATAEQLIDAVDDALNNWFTEFQNF